MFREGKELVVDELQRSNGACPGAQVPPRNTVRRRKHGAVIRADYKCACAIGDRLELLRDRLARGYPIQAITRGANEVVPPHGHKLAVAVRDAAKQLVVQTQLGPLFAV